jgi:DNA-binding transcriptional regulator LsrR (DeoR family)
MSNRPLETLLTARVARMYYLEDRSKSNIADEVGVSRFRVARLLEAARRDGVVKIEVCSDNALDTELSLQLQKAWGLSHAVVLHVEENDPVQLRGQLGEATAGLLLDLVTPQDVLGMAWSRSLSAIGDSLPKFVPCHVVQLTGALARPDGSDVLSLVRRIARAGGGTPHVFYAPMVMPDAAARRALLRQPDVVAATAFVPKVTVAVVGIGGWAPGLSTIYDSLDPAERASAEASGVQAEISGVFVGSDGRTITPPLSRRIVGVSAEQLRGIGTVLAIAYGDAKAHATAAALRSGLVSSLVTHAGLARRLIELSDGELSDGTAAPAQPDQDGGEMATGT